MPTPPNNSTRVDQSLRSTWEKEGDGWVGALPKGWSQGRSIFGGYTAAVAVSLARKVIGDERHLRNFNTQLIGPIVPGPIQASCQVLREGKTATFVEVALLQESKVCLKMQMVFSNAREGSNEVKAPGFTLATPAAELEDMPYMEGLTPECTQHMSMRWAEGSWPFTNAKKAEFKGHCRFKVDAGDDEGMVALLDMWPAPSLSVLNEYAPASTVTWSAHVLFLPKDFSEFFGFEYTTVAGQGGFHTIVGRLYAPSGELCAWTEQLVAIFD
jgi:acyl-CoA thioesterase